MASSRTIGKHLDFLNQVYQRGISEASLATIALVWSNDLQDMPDDIFTRAVEAHRKNSQFWPTPAHIRQEAASLRPNRPPVVAVEEYIRRPEKSRKDVISSAMLLESLRGDNKQKSREFFSCPDWRKKEAIAREVLGSRYKELQGGK